MDDIRTGRCPLCQHDEIIEADLQETDTQGLPSPLPVSWTLRPHGRGWDPNGLLKAYVCRRCGRTELFAVAPERIPIGRAHRTRILRGAAPEGPYR
jgi:hypothetical protein